MNQKIKVFGTVEEKTLNQMKAVCQKANVVRAVLCADNHLGYSVPVGGVIALEKSICVNGVGFDIACGNKAVRLDVNTEEVKNNICRNMNEIFKHISFGVGRNNNEKVEHELFEDPLWNEIPLLTGLKEKAMS